MDVKNDLSGGKPTLLIAEDEESNYLLLKTILHKYCNLIRAKTGLEALALFKENEVNEKYPKTMPLKISSGSGFIHIDQDTKTHNNGCDKPVAYFFIYRVKRIYRFSERPQIEKKGGAE